jgi:hypothetical protein
MAINIDILIKTMHYEPVIACVDTDNIAGTKANDSAATNAEVSTPQEEFVLVEKLKIGPTIIPIQKVHSSQGDDVTPDEPKEAEEGIKIPVDTEKVANEVPKVVEEDSTARPKQSITAPEDSTARPKQSTVVSEDFTARPKQSTAASEDSTARPKQPTAAPEDSTARPEHTTTASKDSTAKPTDPTSLPKYPSVDIQGRSFADLNYPDDPNMPPLENIYYDSDDEALDGTMFGAEADFNNMELNIPVSPTPTTRVHKNHPKDQILSDPSSTVQTRRMTKEQKDILHQSFFARSFHQRNSYKDLQNCLFACFLSQIEPKNTYKALQDPSWLEAMQDELLQFRLQEVLTLVELPNGKRAIGTK